MAIFMARSSQKRCDIRIDGRTAYRHATELICPPVEVGFIDGIY